MEWPVLVIALIPVAVWILATIFRGVEEVKRENRPQARDRDEFRVPRRPAGELDRFLQEARTRRETPSAEIEREPVARPIPMPQRREEPKPKPASPAPVVTLHGPVLQPTPPPAPKARPPAPLSPVLARFQGMLHDRDSLALALVLREVFDRPVSQRQPKSP